MIVYRHIRLDTNQPFYIGIGKTEKRAYAKHQRNKHWHSIVNKHGYKVQIMLDDLTWEEAQQKEREFIQLYGRADLGLGTLANLTNGGDGVLGYKHTEEHIAKLRDIMIGKPKSEETKANMRKPKSKEHVAKSVATKKANGYTYKFTEEHIAKTVATRRANDSYKQSEEHIAKTVATRRANDSYKRSEETKAKLSAALKAYYAKKRMENE